MNWKAMMVLGIALMFAVGCGGSSAETAEDPGPGAGTDSPVADDAGTAEAADDEPGASHDDGYSVEDELVCRANMESIAMFLMTESQMAGSCPATLEELQGIHPSHAFIEIVCSGTPYIYEVDGPDYTIRCPNGHGEVVNGEISWSW